VLFCRSVGGIWCCSFYTCRDQVLMVFSLSFRRGYGVFSNEGPHIPCSVCFSTPELCFAPSPQSCMACQYLIVADVSSILQGDLKLLSSLFWLCLYFYVCLCLYLCLYVSSRTCFLSSLIDLQHGELSQPSCVAFGRCVGFTECM
jgi:hypothetical protein